MARLKPAQEAVPLAWQHCSPDPKRLPVLTAAQRRRLHAQVPEWTLSPKSLSRTWRTKDFKDALGQARRIGKVAEKQRHHPDLHVEGYRNLRAVLSTHAAGGLTLNDFILAAHIDRLAPPVHGVGRRTKRGARPAAKKAGDRKPGLLGALGR